MKLSRMIDAWPVALLLVFTTACGPSGDAASEAAEMSEPTAAVPTGLVNANLATRDDLAAIPGLSAAAVDAILAGRPFLTMAALHETLRSHVAGDAFGELYARVWVPIDLNSATADEILLIPGVGDRMLHEFEEYRPYVAMAQFRREMAKYVDDEEVERLAGYVFVQIDLNTASAEEILAIPGVGERMLHEFEEYRPYTSMEQFRREIGKYVDDGELARLERYVRIN